MMLKQKKKQWLYVLAMVGALAAAVSPALGAAYIVGTQSQDALVQILDQDPNNYAVAYLLGKVLLDQGKRSKAIDAWGQYVDAAPKNDPKVNAVRERLTVLRLQEAAEFARRAARGDGEVSETEIPPNTLAVLNFLAGADDDVVAVLSRGLTAMIITDLAKVPGLKVVEREKMAALLQEIRLGQTGLLDQETAMKGGRLLLARHLVQGSLSPQESANLKISSSVMETINAATLGTPEAEGPRRQIFEMEKNIVFDIINALGLEELDEETKSAIRKRQTDDIEALMAYSEGLGFLDQGEFDKAKESFQEAVSIDPDFEMANEALISTPDTMEIMDIEEVESLDYAEEAAEVEEMEDAEAAETVMAEAPVITMDDLDVVDVAHEVTGEENYEHDYYDEYGETPGLPDQPNVEEPGGIRLEW